MAASAGQSVPLSPGLGWPVTKTTPCACWRCVSGAERIQNELLTGLPARTPVAVIQNASLPTQRHIATTLGQLADSIRQSGMGSPSVIVVGDVMGALALAAEHPGAVRCA